MIHTINIPPQLRIGWRFIKLMEGQKVPFEEDWQNTKNYSCEKIEEYLKIRNNYGVLGGKGKVIIDIDKKSPDFEEAHKAAETLPETFTVETGNKGYHYYFECPDIDNGIRFQKEAGEVRAKGMQVVGPYSEIAGGKKYTPIKNVSIATIKKADIERVFAKWIGMQAKEETTIRTGPKDKSKSGIEFGVVCRQIRKGKNKDYIFQYMNAYKKWHDGHPSYREHTYNAAVKRVELSKKKGIGYIDGAFVPKAMADEILNLTPMKTLKGSGEMYRYCEGLYLNDGKEYIKTLCAEILKNKFTTGHCNETTNYIQAVTFIDPNEVSNEWINLENGLLNPITKEFKEHTPDIFSIIRIPIQYDKAAKCPLWEEKLKEKIDEKTTDVVQETFGYCYLSGQTFQVAFLLYGPRRTMKSTTLFVLEHMLGDENVSSYQLQWLTDNQFGPAYLYGKPANICSDLSTRALKDTGRFMTITGGDKISSSKKHEHPISFYPYSKLFFACNDIPPTTNKNLAFYRRWIILEFKTQTDLKNVDADLKEKMLEELPGILNWSLKGLDRLLEKKAFSYWLNEEDVQDLYERGSNSIQSFIFHHIDTEDDEGALKKRAVYSKYKAYCEEEDLLLENQIKFGRMFIALTGCGTCKQDKIPAYQGVSFKNLLKDNEDEEQKKL